MNSRTKPARRVVPAAQVQQSLNIQGVLRDVQQAFYGLCVNAGKQVLAAMMEADRVALCGANNVPDVSRKAVRGRTTRSSVVLGGQRIAIAKPRARSLQRGELELPSFAWAAGTDPLDTEDKRSKRHTWRIGGSNAIFGTRGGHRSNIHFLQFADDCCRAAEQQNSNGTTRAAGKQADWRIAQRGLLSGSWTRLIAATRRNVVNAVGSP